MGLSLTRVPDEIITSLNFRRLLEKYELAAAILEVINGYLEDCYLLLRHGVLVDATIICASSSTKNKDDKRNPKMHQTENRNQYYFGMKALIGLDADTNLTQSVVAPAANVADVIQVDQLLQREETSACGDSGYTGVENLPEYEGARLLGRSQPGRAVVAGMVKKRHWPRVVQDSTRQVANARQGQSSLPSHQMPIRLNQGAVSPTVKKYGAVGDIVCAIESVEGAKTFDMYGLGKFGVGRYLGQLRHDLA